MEFKDYFHPHKVKWLAIILGSLVVVLAVFQLGMYVGFKKAGFSYRWADNYQRSFGMPRGGFWREVEGRDFMGGHGVSGKVIKVEGNIIYVTGSDNIEKVVSTNETTRIVKAREVINITNLKVDDQIVVIGSPSDNGVIEAKMIRVFGGNLPPPRDKDFAPGDPIVTPTPGSCPPGKFCM